MYFLVILADRITKSGSLDTLDANLHSPLFDAQAHGEPSFDISEASAQWSSIDGTKTLALVRGPAQNLKPSESEGKARVNQSWLNIDTKKISNTDVRPPTVIRTELPLPIHSQKPLAGISNIPSEKLNPRPSSTKNTLTPNNLMKWGKIQGNTNESARLDEWLRDRDELETALIEEQKQFRKREVNEDQKKAENIRGASRTQEISSGRPRPLKTRDLVQSKNDSIESETLLVRNRNADRPSQNKRSNVSEWSNEDAMLGSMKTRMNPDRSDRPQFRSDERYRDSLTGQDDIPRRRSKSRGKDKAAPTRDDDVPRLSVSRGRDRDASAGDDDAPRNRSRPHGRDTVVPTGDDDIHRDTPNYHWRRNRDSTTGQAGIYNSAPHQRSKSSDRTNNATPSHPYDNIKQSKYPNSNQTSTTVKIYSKDDDPRTNSSNRRPSPELDSDTRSIVSARNIRPNRRRLATATINDIMNELSTDETKYMRELRTLVDGVLPVLLSSILSKSETETKTAARMFSRSAKGDLTNVTKPIIDMGVSLERLKSLHKRVPKDSPDNFLLWAQSARRVYSDYIKAWRLGFEDICISVDPADEIPRTPAKVGQGQKDAAPWDEGLPRNADGFVINEDGERVDVAYLLKRPLVRIKCLAKSIQVSYTMIPSWGQ